MSRWRTVHAFIGAFGVVAFVLTGQYMHWFRGQLHGMPDGTRMLYRSAHIYLLSASVANVLLGCYFQPGTDPGVRRLQSCANVAMAALPMLFATSFFAESEGGSLVAALVSEPADQRPQALSPGNNASRCGTLCGRSKPSVASKPAREQTLTSSVYRARVELS
jgi:hypothetical protein